MQIKVKEDTSVKETEISIVCKEKGPEVDKIIDMLHKIDRKLSGYKSGQTYLLTANSILYIDTVDKKTFFYTEDEIYETSLRLYELEEELSSLDFFRAGKSCVINFNHIKAIKPQIDGRLLVTMSNDEKLFVSRQYASMIKRKLGVVR